MMLRDTTSGLCLYYYAATVLCVLHALKLLSLSLPLSPFPSLPWLSFSLLPSLPWLSFSFLPSLPCSLPLFFYFSPLSSQDETLVHCSLSPLENPEFTFNVEFEGEVYDVSALLTLCMTYTGGQVIHEECMVLSLQVNVRLRPYFRQFLERVSELFEVKFDFK